MKSKDIRHFPFRVEETVGETDNIDINQLVEAEAILIGALLFLFIFLAPILYIYFLYSKKMRATGKYNMEIIGPVVNLVTKFVNFPQEKKKKWKMRRK